MTLKISVLLAFERQHLQIWNRLIGSTFIIFWTYKFEVFL